MSHESFRRYQREFPEVGEIVIVEITEISEVGMYVKLIEYDGALGFVQLSECSKKGKPIQTRPGTKEILLVISVDEKKLYIDLSKKKLLPDERDKARELFSLNANLFKTISIISDNSKESKALLYQEIVWKLSPTDLLININIDLLKVSEIVKECLRDEIKLAVNPLERLYQCFIEVVCFSSEGIDGIKQAFKCVKDEYPLITSSLRVPPLYQMKLKGVQEEEALEILNKALVILDREIQKNGGTMSVKIPPHVFTSDAEVEKLIIERYKAKTSM